MRTGYYNRRCIRFLAYGKIQKSSIIALIRELVECESPSDDPAAVIACEICWRARWAKARGANIPGGRFGSTCAACEFNLPGPRKPREGAFGVAHSDTVWPLGKLAQMPFRQKKMEVMTRRARHEVGDSFFLFATRALRELDIPVARRVVLQFNSDERWAAKRRARLPRKQREAARLCWSRARTGLTGKIKTARKGVGDYTVMLRASVATRVDFDKRRQRNS